MPIFSVGKMLLAFSSASGRAAPQSNAQRLDLLRPSDSSCLRAQMPFDAKANAESVIDDARSWLRNNSRASVSVLGLPCALPRNAALVAPRRDACPDSMMRSFVEMLCMYELALAPSCVISALRPI